VHIPATRDAEQGIAILEFAMALETEFGIDLTSVNPGRELLMDLNRLEARLRG